MLEVHSTLHPAHLATKYHPKATAAKSQSGFSLQETLPLSSSPVRQLQLGSASGLPDRLLARLPYARRV